MLATTFVALLCTLSCISAVPLENGQTFEKRMFGFDLPSLPIDTPLTPSKGSKKGKGGLLGGLPGADMLPVPIPAIPGADKLPVAIPGADKLPIPVPAIPGADKLPVSIPSIPGADKLPVQVPAIPGADKLPVSIPGVDKVVPSLPAASTAAAANVAATPATAAATASANTPTTAAAPAKKPAPKKPAPKKQAPPASGGGGGMFGGLFGGGGGGGLPGLPALPSLPGLGGPGGLPGLDTLTDPGKLMDKVIDPAKAMDLAMPLVDLASKTPLGAVLPAQLDPSKLKAAMQLMKLADPQMVKDLLNPVKMSMLVAKGTLDINQAKEIVGILTAGKLDPIRLMTLGWNNEFINQGLVMPMIGAGGFALGKGLTDGSLFSSIGTIFG